MNFLYKAFTQSDLDRLFDRLRGPRVQVQDTYAIDEASGTCLISLGQLSPGRDNDSTAYYNLLRDEHTIAIEAYETFVRNEEETVLHFEMTLLKISGAACLDLECLRRMVEDAVSAYMSGLFRRPIKVRATLPLASA